MDILILVILAGVIAVLFRVTVRINDLEEGIDFLINRNLHLTDSEDILITRVKNNRHLISQIAVSMGKKITKSTLENDNSVYEKLEEYTEEDRQKEKLEEEKKELSKKLKLIQMQIEGEVNKKR